MSRSKKGKWTAPEGLRELEQKAATMTDAELIADMGVASSTFYKWLKDCPEIAGAIDKGRNGVLAAAAVKEVEGSLFERCVGGTHTVTKGIKVREVKYDGLGKRISEIERVELVQETVYVPADTAAIKFFLTNRAPEKWKNRTELSTDDDMKESIEAFLQRQGEGGREF